MANTSRGEQSIEAVGLFMTVIVTLLLELFAGTTLSRERLLSREFLLRTALCLLVFGASGAISSYARWRSRQALFGKTRN